MSVAMRVAAFFVAGDRAVRERAAVAPATTVVLLAPPAAVSGLGSVLASALARRAQAPAGVVLAWVPAGPASPTGPRLPGAPAASRLARSLAARDIPAQAGVRLVHAALPAADGDAAAAARRAAAAIPPAIPAVVALGGARGPALDGLLAAADLVVVAGREGDPATAMARAGAACVADRVVVWSALPGGAVRRLAALGLAGPGVGTVPARVVG